MLTNSKCSWFNFFFFNYTFWVYKFYVDVMPISKIVEFLTAVAFNNVSSHQSSEAAARF